MKCHEVRRILLSQPDLPVPAAQADEFSSHLQTCEQCQRTAERLDATDSVLRCDASHVARVSVSDGFAAIMSERLADEQHHRESAPVARVERLLEVVTDSAVPWPRLVARAAAIAMGFCAALLLATASMTGPVQQPHTDYAPAHVAALSLSTARDGRLYARLDSGTGRSRYLTREDLR
jgi:anti-sigma factor RsiW